MSWFNRFMYGRNGFDALVGVCFGGAVLLTGMSGFAGFRLLRWLLSTAGYLLLVLAFYRFLSHDVGRRRVENQRLMELLHRKKPIKGSFREKKFSGFGKKTKAAKASRTADGHCFFTCASCGSSLRVPAGKGRITITCPKCKTVFEAQT